MSGKINGRFTCVHTLTFGKLYKVAFGLFVYNSDIMPILLNSDTSYPALST